MKKTYINPEIMIVRLKTMRMIAASDKSMSVSNRSASEWGSRGRSGSWDDDDY